MAERDLTIWTQMHSTIGGRKAHGWYRADAGMVMVETTGGKKATHIGGNDPTTLAYIMLRELADEGKAWTQEMPRPLRGAMPAIPYS
jgi:hypothetical protein